MFISLWCVVLSGALSLGTSEQNVTSVSVWPEGHPNRCLEMFERTNQNVKRFGVCSDYCIPGVIKSILFVAVLISFSNKIIEIILTCLKLPSMTYNEYIVLYCFCVCNKYCSRLDEQWQLILIYIDTCLWM